MARVLRVGLTGGIGSGKSTVARRLAEHGAVVIDADLLAREVVQPGSAGLADVVRAFGDGVLDAEGALDRAALAAKVFSDDEQRTRLNAIMHPLIGARTAELMNEAAEDAVVLHDVPLLVENELAANYHLVIVVHADVESRVDRLAHARGIPENDARARVAAQATEEQRREVADVWLDNSGAPDELLPTVDALWVDRLVAYESNVRLNRVADRGAARLVAPDPEWSRTARRLMARLHVAGGARIRRIDHIGSTAIVGMPAKNVIDLQVAVDSIEEADRIAPAISSAGFPPLPHITEDAARGGMPGDWRKRLHAAADPAQPAHVHVRVLGSPGWRYALLMRDWLRAEPEAAQEYRELKEKLAETYASDMDFERYTIDKEPWLDATLPRAEQWAKRTAWSPEAH